MDEFKGPYAIEVVYSDDSVEFFENVTAWQVGTTALVFELGPLRRKVIPLARVMNFEYRPMADVMAEAN